MASTTRNITVGLTVIVAIAAFGWMVLHFGAKSAALFSPPQMPVHLTADRADGLAEGSAISYLGVTVGRVTSLSLDGSHQSVTMEGLVDTVPGIPQNVTGKVRPQSYISSGASVSLETDGPPSATMLQPGATIKTDYVGNVLFPKEFTETADQARLLIQELSDSHIIDHMDVTVKTVNKAVESIQQITSNPQLQDDLVKAVASIRQSADTAERITANLESFTGKDLPQLSAHLDKTITSADVTMTNANTAVTTANDSIKQVRQQLDDVLGQADKLLDQTTQVAAKVNDGKGTAGELVNDPKLYANLVETTNKLNATVDDLKVLIEQWQQEGVSLKVK